MERGEFQIVHSNWALFLHFAFNKISFCWNSLHYDWHWTGILISRSERKQQKVKTKSLWHVLSKCGAFVKRSNYEEREKVSCFHIKLALVSWKTKTEQIVSLTSRNLRQLKAAKSVGFLRRFLLKLMAKIDFIRRHWRKALVKRQTYSARKLF